MVGIDKVPTIVIYAYAEMRLIGVIIFSYILSFANAQSIYYSSIEDLDEDTLLKTEIGLLDLLTCQITQLYIDTTRRIPGIGVIGYYEWTDISLCPDGRLFGLGHDGIYEIDIMNQSELKLFEPDNPPFRFWFSGLYCSKDSVLYFGQRDIGSYDLNTDLVSYYGRLPSSTSLFSNLFWYGGRLMGSGGNKIVEVDLTDIPNSTVHCALQGSGYLSLVEVAICCDSIAVFAFDTGGEVYLLNPLDCSRTHYCTIPQNISESFQGITPNFMFMPPEPCQMGLDLDILDMTIEGIDYIDTFYCLVPDPFLLSVPDLFSDKSWDSLIVWIESGPADLALDGTAASYATLQGQMTSRLRYISTGLADFNVLSSKLTTLSIIGEMPDGVTNLTIGFCGFADYLITDTAYAHITLFGRTTYAGLDTTVTMCRHDDELVLNSLLDSEITLGGHWHPNAIFDPLVDPAGNYFYIIDDPYCPPDSASFDIRIYTEPLFNLGPDRLLCPGDTTQFSISIPDVNLIWSDGSSQPLLVVTETGTVWVELIDVYDCRYVDSAAIVTDEACLIEQLYIPSVFSPNGDDINDTWSIHPDAVIDRAEIQIFDRWGNNLFINTGGSLFWDGRSKDGRMVPLGVYVYLIKIQLGSGSVFLRTGDVTVVR